LACKINLKIHSSRELILIHFLSHSYYIVLSCEEHPTSNSHFWYKR